MDQGLGQQLWITAAAVFGAAVFAVWPLGRALREPCDCRRVARAARQGLGCGEWVSQTTPGAVRGREAKGDAVRLARACLRLRRCRAGLWEKERGSALRGERKKERKESTKEKDREHSLPF